MFNQLITLETAKLAKEKGFDILQEEVIFDNGNSCGNIVNSVRSTGTVRWIHSNGMNIDEWMKKDFVNAKEIYERPSQHFLQKWLREMYNLHITIYPVLDKWCGDVRILDGKTNSSIVKFESSDSYEDVLEVGLKKALSLVRPIKAT